WSWCKGLRRLERWDTAPGTGPSDVDPRSGHLAAVVARVELDEALPLLRHLVLGGDGINRAGLNARVAVDALLGIDIELIDLVVVRLVGRWVDAVDGADLDAGVVLDPDARLADHVGQGSAPPEEFPQSICRKYYRSVT